MRTRCHRAIALCSKAAMQSRFSQYLATLAVSGLVTFALASCDTVPPGHQRSKPSIKSTAGQPPPATQAAQRRRSKIGKAKPSATKPAVKPTVTPSGILGLAPGNAMTAKPQTLGDKPHAPSAGKRLDKKIKAGADRGLEVMMDE